MIRLLASWPLLACTSSYSILTTISLPQTSIFLTSEPCSSHLSCSLIFSRKTSFFLWSSELTPKCCYCCIDASVMSDSVRPHRRQPTRLPRPWDSPGKNTGVGCHFLLQCMKVKSESEVAQSCLTLSDLMDCSLPGSSVHGIFQARVLEWGAIAFSEHLNNIHLILLVSVIDVA